MSEEQEQDRSKKAWEASGVLVPAGLLMGMAVGAFLLLVMRLFKTMRAATA